MNRHNPGGEGRAVALPSPVARERALVRLRDLASPVFFLGPAGLAVVVFFLVPVLLTLWIGLTDMSVATISNIQFVGVENYVRMLTARYTPRILQNTFFYVFTTLGLFNVGMGLAIALLTTHIEERAGTLFRTLWLLPRITPSVIYALLWTWATADAPFGIFNQLLSPLGVTSQNWLSTQPWAIVIAANGFVGASFSMIIFTSAIKAIPQDYIVAAKVDGASTWQIICRITVPMIRWPIMFVTAYQTLSLLTSFEYILLLTDGGPGFYRTEVWALHAFHRALSNYFGNVQFGYGAALAAVLVVIGIIASVAYLRIFRFGQMVAEPKIEVR